MTQGSFSSLPPDVLAEWSLLCRETLSWLGVDPPALSGFSSPHAVGIAHQEAASSSGVSIREQLSAVPPAAESFSKQRPSTPIPTSRSTVSSSTMQSAGGLSLGARILPFAHQWPGEPFALEPMGASAPEAFSDLQSVLHQHRLTPALAPLPDDQARFIRDRWREQALCADLLLVGAPDESAPLFQRLVSALVAKVCPAVWVNVCHLQSLEQAEPILLHPAVRLILITREACASAPWLQTLWAEEPTGSHWKGKPAVLLDWGQALLEDPSSKKRLWEGLQGWKRGL